MGELRGETIPILPACDIAETVDFYGKLGFAVVRLWEGFGAPYLILRRDDVELHFFHDAGTDAKRNDHGCYLRLADAQGVYDEWAPLGLAHLHPISDTPWGMREFSVSDPSGNLLRVGTRLPD
jgi:catechol 2,3-dioxygenase-like lactoylglutathione lyase family enzyme